VAREDGGVRGAPVRKEGELMWPPPKPPAPPPKPVEARRPSVPPPPPVSKGGHGAAKPRSLGVVLTALTVLLLAGSFAPREFVAHLTVFVLACFIGWQVIWNVTPA